VNIATKNQSVALDTFVARSSPILRSRIAVQHRFGHRREAVSIVADPALIDDLLSNLIDNALKYTPPAAA